MSSGRKDVKRRKMRALQVVSLGDPCGPLDGSVLQLGQDFAPVLASGDIRVRIEAASLNFADLLQAQGLYQEKPLLPYIPGSEVSGVVTETGNDVHNFKKGDQVTAVLWSGGGFAEECTVPACNAIRLPRGVDLAAAAGLPVAFGTAHTALIERARLQAGQVLLVLGAGGGVGVAAVQIGKMLGAKVIAVARGRDKMAMLDQLGADLAIDSGLASKPLKQRIKSIAPSGVDVVLDTVGGAGFDQALRAVRWGAQVLVIGFASGDVPQIPANIALVKNLTVHGVYWGSYASNAPRVMRKSLEDCVQWLAQGKIRVPVSHRFPLHEAPSAFAALRDRLAVGKVLLLPGSTAKAKL